MKMIDATTTNLEVDAVSPASRGTRGVIVSLLAISLLGLLVLGLLIGGLQT